MNIRRAAEFKLHPHKREWVRTRIPYLRRSRTFTLDLGRSQNDRELRPKVSAKVLFGCGLYSNKIAKITLKNSRGHASKTAKKVNFPLQMSPNFRCVTIIQANCERETQAAPRSVHMFCFRMLILPLCVPRAVCLPHP